MVWEIKTKDKFSLMISKIPVFHRHITEEAVVKKAQDLAKVRNCAQVEEQDVVAAFFSEVPAAFYSMMIRLMEQIGYDYKKFGFPKTEPYSVL